MGDGQMMSELYQENMKRQNKNRRRKDAAAFLCILLGSLIVAVNMNTFVEQGELVPGGFTGLAKLIQRIGLSFYDVQISFTLLNVLFNAVPAVFAYRLVGKKFTILSCICLLTVSILVDELPVVPITGDILLISVFGGIINGLGDEPGSQQQGLRRRNGLYRHVSVGKIQGIHLQLHAFVQRGHHTDIGNHFRNG